VKLDLVFPQSDIDWLSFPIKVWSILSHDIDHTQSGEGKGRRSSYGRASVAGLYAKLPLPISQNRRTAWGFSPLPTSIRLPSFEVEAGAPVDDHGRSTAVLQSTAPVAASTEDASQPRPTR
jgi:hypothetical protein